ncbi:MAG: tetratricopeptide repeat protein [Anaerolineales bacterium]
MKKTLVLLVLVGMLLAGCGASDVPADTPTMQPTDTQSPPTPTPEPTATPTPEPTLTPTPTPTPEPTLMPLSDLMAELEQDELFTLIEAENGEYRAGYYRWAIGISNVIIDSYLNDHPAIYVIRSESYSKLGDFENAIKDLETAAQFPYLDDPDINASMYNNLCWYLAITDQPDRALPYCEQSVALFSEIANLDSRAMVYGMLGRTEDAISDFEQVLEMGEDDEFGFYADLIEERKQWLEALKNGEDPFTPELLEKLQQESIDPDAYPEPEMLTDYSRQHFVQTLESDGFDFVGSGETPAGVEYMAYGVISGECQIIVGIYGSEDEILSSRLVLNGCKDDQLRGEIGWFGRLMLLSDPYQEADDCFSLGELYAWQITEVDSLIAKDTSITNEIHISEIRFQAGWDDSGTALRIDADMD